MSAKLACIVPEAVGRRLDSGELSVGNISNISRRSTPFGPSGDIFAVTEGKTNFYLLCRTGAGLDKVAPHKVNYRANVYALKDLGVDCIVGCGPVGAITHNIAIGELVIPDDVIDQTHLRAGTMFENSPLGLLRAFPVFCPSLRPAVAGVLHDLAIDHHGSGTIAVREGPRLETPAEVRMLASAGAELVAHTFAPEMFLAKELQMCYAGLAYVFNFAETGSKRQPFAAGRLFGGLAQESPTDRLAGAIDKLPQIFANLAKAVADADITCQCRSTMTHHVEQYNLPDDWRQWPL